MSQTPHNKRILMFSSAEQPYHQKVNKQFVADLNELVGPDIEIEWHNYHDIRLEFETDTMRAYIQSTGEPLESFRFVYFKSYLRYSEQAAAIAAYLDAAHVPFACSELREYLPMTKLTQFTRLALSGVPIAPTIYLDTSAYTANYDFLVGRLGTPFIFKSTYGKGGDQNYLIHSPEELAKAIEADPDLAFVAQRFIENESDLRILVVDRKIELVIERRRTSDTHLNNTSQGAAAALMPLENLSPEHQSLALQSAALLNREIAGVDLMFETGTGHPYILEVNASPQIGSGAYTKEKLEIYSNYFKNMLK